MTKPLLSICIPTYNRAEYLEKSLESLVSQKDFSRIEVVISDNCSTDNTEELCKSFTSQYPNIIYHRNSENIHDRNFPSVLMLANGIYRKLFNDTILYGEDFIVFLLQLISEHIEDRPFIFLLNGQILPKGIVFTSECNNFSDFCKICGHRLTWIASFGLWEDDCKNLEDEFPLCDTMIWQSHKAMKIVSSGKKVLLVRDKFFSVQHVNRRDFSYGLYTVFYKNFPELLNQYFVSGQLSESDVAFIRKDMLYTQSCNWLFDISANNDLGEEKDFKEKILSSYRKEKYYTEFRFWYACHYGPKLIKKRFLNFLKAKIGKGILGKELINFKRRFGLKFY